VVSAPTGAGKTLAAASWAIESSWQVIWINVSHGGDDPDRVWRELGDGLRALGVDGLPVVPRARGYSSRRISALADLGAALRDRDPLVVVLDGYPPGAPSQLGTETEIVLEHAQGALRLVVLCQAEPALGLHRSAASGELTRVDAVELELSELEIGEILRRAGLAHDKLTRRTVRLHTAGWACGVRQAAVALQGETDLAAAMVATDRLIADYLSHEVLQTMPESVRDLIVWSSVAEEVAPGLARTVLRKGVNDVVARTIGATGLVRRTDTNTLRYHPLLRSAGRSQLVLDPPDLSEEKPRRFLTWLIEHDEEQAAIELALAAGDWSCAAGLLVEGHTVPRLIAGTAGSVLERSARLGDVQSAEPLLRAAVALSDLDADTAQVALDLVDGEEDRSEAYRLALSMTRLAVARLSGRPLVDAGLVTEARALVARMPAGHEEVRAGLVALLNALTSAVEVGRGEHHRAIVALTRGAGVSEGRCLSAPEADCAGQLALLHAYEGNLRRATQLAAQVLATLDPEWELGAAHAHAAMALVHLDQGADDLARRSIEAAADTGRGGGEPWVSAVLDTTRARLLLADGRPEAALMMTESATLAGGGRVRPDWLAGFLTTASAEALLAAGEPQRALAVLASGRIGTSVERVVLTAGARRDIGDARGANAALTSVVDDLPLAPLAVQLQAWLLEMRLVHDQGNVDRARLLAERALRAAEPQELRRPFVREQAWLHWFLDREPALLRAHRAFATSLFPTHAAPRSSRPSAAETTQPVLEPLTERETQVLELLAQMYSTEEIAAELFVSANTVKTHLKGIFRKLCVNRRVHAVRRGRELGLC
jgi:LuxR family maltose regulon positive regulatory protein